MECKAADRSRLFHEVIVGINLSRTDCGISRRWERTTIAECIIYLFRLSLGVTVRKLSWAETSRKFSIVRAVWRSEGVGGRVRTR